MVFNNTFKNEATYLFGKKIEDSRSQIDIPFKSHQHSDDNVSNQSTNNPVKIIQSINFSNGVDTNENRNKKIINIETEKVNEISSINTGHIINGKNDISGMKHRI